MLWGDPAGVKSARNLRVYTTDRKKESGLTTLETRRERGDLIEGFEDVNSELFFHWKLILHIYVAMI